MTMTSLLGGLAGLLVVLGLITVVSAGRRVPTAPAPTKVQTFTRRTRHTDSRRVTAAALVGATVWLLTGWPVAGLIAAAAVAGLPLLLSTSKVAARGISRLEAIEDWTRRLSDILVVGVGLEQAIATSLKSVPEPIRPEVSTLSARLVARVPTEEALRQFADELADPMGDFVVAALILGHRRRGPGLARALSSVADSVSEEVALRRRVEADRAKPRTTARAVTLITLGVVGVGAMNGAYIQPYGTAVGQLVLLSVTAMFIAALTWMRALTLSKPQPRLLASTRRQE
jgi:Flp pilus assembly protein TadB